MFSSNQFVYRGASCVKKSLIDGFLKGQYATVVVGGWDACLWVATAMPLQLPLWYGMVNIVPCDSSHLHGDILELAHSLNLSFCNYFLWGYLKAQVFKHSLQTTEELKDFICHEIVPIPDTTSRTSRWDFRSVLLMKASLWMI